MMSQLFAPTLDEQIACIERELRYRRYVYDRRVFSGKMTRAAADREIEVMSAVLETVRAAKTANAARA